MSIIIEQGCNKPQIWNITELVNIEQLTKMDNERGKRLDLRWWSNYVEVSVKLVISGLRMNGFSRMICQLVKLPLGEQCLSSWRRGLGTPRLSTSTPLPPHHPQAWCPLLGSCSKFSHDRVGRLKEHNIRAAGTQPEWIGFAQYHIVPPNSEKYCTSLIHVHKLIFLL